MIRLSEITICAVSYKQYLPVYVYIIYLLLHVLNHLQPNLLLIYIFALKVN